MANAPAFASVPRLEVAAVSTANTARDGTGTIVDVLTGAAAGTRIERVVVQATGDPADSVVTIFVHNGTSWFLYDEIDLNNPTAAGNAIVAFRYERRVDDLVLESTSMKLGAAITVAPTSGVVNVFALGADIT